MRGDSSDQAVEPGEDLARPDEVLTVDPVEDFAGPDDEALDLEIRLMEVEGFTTPRWRRGVMWLRELRQRRAEDQGARANLAAVGVVEEGPIDQLVCTLAALYLELQQKAEVAPCVPAERVRQIVRSALVALTDLADLTDRQAAAITDRVVAELTTAGLRHQMVKINGRES